MPRRDDRLIAFGGSPTVYRSPDGRREARVSAVDSPGMGVVEYDFRLSEAARNDPTPSELKVPGRKSARFQHPGGYQPWTHDSSRLLLAFHGGGTIVYDVESARVHPLPLAHPRSKDLQVASCSPRGPVAFVAPDGRDGGSFFDLEDPIRRLFTLQFPLDRSFFFWHEEGWLLALVQHSDRASAELRMYDPLRAEPLGTLDLSARVLLPFDEPAYAELRNLDALAVPSTQPSITNIRLGGARWLIDLWCSAHFVSPDRLYLRVYRPTGRTRKPWFAPNRAAAVVALTLSGQGWVCPAEPRWIEVRLDLAVQS